MDTEQTKPGVKDNASESGSDDSKRARETAREELRKRRERSGRKSTGTPRTASPTRSIEPGLVHRKIAEGILTGVHNRTGLDVGEFPESDNVAGTEQDDPTRLAGIVSHIVARTFDRFGPLRKLSRQAEGADKRSGLISDAFAAAVELYRRNPDKLQEIASEYARELKAKRAAAPQRTKRSKRTAAASPNGSGEGKAQPIGVVQ